MNKYEKIASSNIEYEEKIKKLKEERESIINTYNYYVPYIDETIINLENGKYLKDMIEERNYYDKWTTISASLGAFGLGVGVGSIYNFATTHMLIYIPIGATFLIFGSIGVSSAIDTLKECNKYDKEIESYQRRLK